MSWGKSTQQFTDLRTNCCPPRLKRLGVRDEFFGKFEGIVNFVTFDAIAFEDFSFMLFVIAILGYGMSFFFNLFEIPPEGLVCNLRNPFSSNFCHSGCPCGCNSSQPPPRIIRRCCLRRCGFAYELLQRGNGHR
jgi:hypothetical protein